jgi:hypothetical protein
MASAATSGQPCGRLFLTPEVLMSAPPDRTSPAAWEATGERPAQSARHPRSRKVGLALVGLMLVLVAVVLLFVL